MHLIFSNNMTVSVIDKSSNSSISVRSEDGHLLGVTQVYGGFLINFRTAHSEIDVGMYASIAGIQKTCDRCAHEIFAEHLQKEKKSG